VPAALGDFMILDAVRESGGWAVAVAEERIVDAMRRAVAAEGISICPEAAACVLAIESLVADGRIRAQDRVVLFNTGAATKYIETVRLDLPVISDPGRFSYDDLA
jgi:threonine synthase